ncbi:VRR-NUC domain-containing protein [Paracoccaceae bacterium]|nr:VRR-NUC domain-containing protein [Paracoccaceae bacterium]
MCTLDEPKLPISYLVRGRRTRSDNRVEYLVDSQGINRLNYAIPEKIVLKRWRSRQASSYHYGGTRLSPNIWRSIKEALGEDVSLINELSASDIDQKYTSAKIRLDTLNYKTVPGENIRRLIVGLGVKKFQCLLDRHNQKDRKEIYGTPDLFLWTLTPRQRRISDVKFVEVKKPNEPLSQDQKDEINFLREVLDVTTILVRLREV